MIHLTPNLRQAAPALQRLEAWAAEWRSAFRRAAADADLARRLESHDEHLLRDMGLVRTEGRLEPIEPDRNPWR